MMVGCWVLIAYLQKLVLVRHRPLTRADSLDLILSDYVCVELTHINIFARQWMIGRSTPAFKTIANDVVTNGTWTDVGQFSLANIGGQNPTLFRKSAC
jgi:hypothetical protein